MASKEATTPMDDIEKTLICSLCLDVLKLPKTLPCTHSYCEKCLQEYLESKAVQGQEGVHCPLCRNFSKHGEFINIYMIKELLELYWLSKEKRARQCFACESNNKEAVWKCTDCKINLCEMCQKAHTRLPTSRSHKYITCDADTDCVIDVNVYCDGHPDQVVDLYCTQCKRPICIKCKITDHDSHKSETIESKLGEMIPKVKGELKLVEDQVKSLKDEYERLKLQVSEVEDQHSQKMRQCAEKREELVSKIDEWRKETEKALTEAKEKNLMSLKKAQDMNEKQTKIKESVIQLTNATLASAKGCSLLKALTTEVIERVKQEQKVTHASVNITEPTVQTLSSTDLNIHLDTAVFDPQLNEILPAVLDRNSRCFDVNISEVLTKIKTVSRDTKNLDDHADRLSLVGGNLWMGSDNDDNGNYQVFDTASKTLILHECSYENGIRSFCETRDNKVIAVCKTGLSLLRQTGAFVFKFSTDDFADACINDNRLFAVKSEMPAISIFAPAHESWQKVQDLSTNDCFDTICTDHEYLYMSLKEYRTIKKYSLEGICIDEFGSHGMGPGKFREQYVCGTDKGGSLVACDTQNRRFQVRKSSGIWEEFQLTGISCPNDMLVVKDCVYVLWRRRTLNKLSWYKYST